jgi:hypothetical protein
MGQPEGRAEAISGGVGRLLDDGLRDLGVRVTALVQRAACECSDAWRCCQLPANALCAVSRYSGGAAPAGYPSNTYTPLQSVSDVLLFYLYICQGRCSSRLVCMYVCMYVCRHLFVHAYVCLYVCMSVSMNIYVHI